MGQTLYLQCDFGISGDMTVAALLDLGADEELLKRTLSSLPLSGFEIEIKRVKKAGLDVCDFNVRLDKEHENYDHDIDYLYGHEYNTEYREHGYAHVHSHGEEREHNHAHSHGEEGEHSHMHSHSDGTGHHHAHEHRSLSEIQDIIRRSDMRKGAKELAFRIFDVLACAEAKAHGTKIEEVHFHEVGAVDSIVDIVAAAVCLDNLNVTEVIVPYLCEGRGTVRCQHGILPIPVPAVANIVKDSHITLHLTNTYGELVTPTGAAIVAAVGHGEKLPEKFTVQKVGMGGGKRNYEQPSILRAMLIQPESAGREENIYKLETNIDDCTGEALGYTMERLFENGAADVNYIPVFMKKNRPAYLLTVICSGQAVKKMEEIIFQETTTIGIRKIKMERTILERECETMHLPAGDIRVKKCVLPDGTVRRYPEYEAMAELAKSTGKTFQEILRLYRHCVEDA